MAVYELNGIAPQVHETAWVADSAEVIGHVHLAQDANVWFGTIIRGDHANPIRIGARTNIQDGCVLHDDSDSPLTIGNDVTVGHKVILHGCTIGDGALIGMGAVVLNGAKIGRHCLVGAGALVTEGKEFPEGSLIVGSPAVAKRVLSPEQIAGLQRSANGYVANAQRFRKGLKKVG